MKRILAATTVLLLMLTSLASAAIKTETVEYKQGDTTLKGFLAYDDGSTDKRPAVIIVHEWWGITDYTKRRAQDVAKLGYVAFVADMFGDGKTTKDPKEAGAMAGAVKGDANLLRARAQAAMDFVTKQPLVDNQRVAAMGYCFGGTVSLEMARGGMPLLGAVSFHGTLATKNPAEAGKLKAKILALHGADDPFVPHEEVLGFAKEMQDAQADWQLVAYGNAVHSFTNPDADSFGIPGVKYNAAADRRSWEAMKNFFTEIFRGPAGGNAQAKPAANAAKLPSTEYYVNGSVERPGMYVLSINPGGRMNRMWLTDAVISAGVKAALRDVRITLIRTIGEATQTTEHELSKLLEDKGLDVMLQAGDQLIVRGNG